MTTKASNSAVFSQAEARDFDSQIGTAIIGLQRHAFESSEVHRTRNRLTRMRASLRLLRASLGDENYRWCNEGIRNAARQLNTLRDAQVLVQTAGRLRRSTDTIEVKRMIAGLIQVLTDDRDATCPTQAAARESTAMLRAIRCRVRKVSQSEVIGVSPAAGLVETYRKCRQAFRRAKRHPTDTHLHEWRKQMKYLFCETAALARLELSELSRMNRQASQLTLCLGEDHDLAVLQNRISDSHLRVRTGTTRGCIDILYERSHSRRVGLQGTAMRLGKICFSQRARRFGKKLNSGLRRVH